uniref:VWFA domain-containing protein n=1 Tax=Denticeps clupeoides TaxID=299321 RepID=A0AAY4DA41_9TELE
MNPLVKMVEVDGSDLVKDFAEEMEKMLGRKMIKNVFLDSISPDSHHEMNSGPCPPNGNYVELGQEFPLEKNEHFNKLPVNTQMSSIQVPTNVYNKDSEILNGVYMSEALNDIFVDNFEKDPTLTWQYFGSATGFFRLYPGIQWTPDENGVVAFDARNRNWYIQAATSPKDIIIVVDISGSMKGLRLTIAKHTINTILETLGENDFVNVIAYSDYVSYVEPCFKGTLVQADLDNREHFKLLVEQLQVKGEGKVKKAMKESFRVLNEAAAMGQGSLCNQAIMLITDGAMEDFQEVFEEFNWPERRVRVFTYLIGRELTFAENVKWIACNNKGYYTHISTLADVQENVMEYLHVLSRPMVINHDHDIIWTEAYMDTVVGLSHGILLGVVGTDVPLRELMRLAPRYKLGVHGYAFLNTNNGYILSHPDLRPLYKEGKKLKPKPNYNSVDLSEVEWEDVEENVSVKRVLFLKNDYFYTTINETPFSLGIVLTRGHGEYIFIGNISVEEGLHDLTTSDVTIANEWTYCETDIDPHHRKYSQLQAVIRYLTGKEPELECDEELLQQTMFDAVVTAPMEAYWTAIMLNTSGLDEGIETAFLGTRSGLMRVIRFAENEKRVAKKFLSPLDKENIFTLDHFPVWYRRAAENPAGKFLYYIPREDTRGIFPNMAVTACLRVCVCVCVCVYPRASLHRVSLYDYQAMCKMSQHSASSARPLLSVRALCSISVCAERVVRCSYTKRHCCHSTKNKADVLQPCDTEYPSFVYDPSIKETNSIIKCGRCQKMFVGQQIPDSNLLLMVVQSDCDCSRHPRSVWTLDISEHNASVKCDRMKSMKIRRRPESCHAYHPQVPHSFVRMHPFCSVLFLPPL